MQFTTYGVTGSKLTHRIRAKAFAAFLRQEVAYFDLQQNSSSSICNRLSSDALAVQQLIGTRLGIISENLAMLVVGLIFGALFSWQIALIFFGFLLVGLVFAYIFIKLQSLLARKCAALSERASSVISNYC